MVEIVFFSFPGGKLKYSVVQLVGLVYILSPKALKLPQNIVLEKSHYCNIFVTIKRSKMENPILFYKVFMCFVGYNIVVVFVLFFLFVALHVERAAFTNMTKKCSLLRYNVKMVFWLFLVSIRHAI